MQFTTSTRECLTLGSCVDALNTLPLLRATVLPRLKLALNRRGWDCSLHLLRNNCSHYCDELIAYLCAKPS